MSSHQNTHATNSNGTQQSGKKRTIASVEMTLLHIVSAVRSKRIHTCAQGGLACIVVHSTMCTTTTLAAATTRTLYTRAWQSSTLKTAVDWASIVQTAVVNAGGHVDESVVLGASGLVHRTRVHVVQVLAC